MARNNLIMTPTALPNDAPLQWRTCPSVVRAWAFWLCIFTLSACGALMLWGVTLFSSSATAGIAATGGGLLLAALFITHLLAIRRGWGFGWPLQLGWSALFLISVGLAVVLKFGFARAEEFPTNQKIIIGFGVLAGLAHIRILLGWFKTEVKAWFGRGPKVL